MANFQFGQDNVGSGWQVPSWYVQGMSQSPMAASIAGLGNSIAAFSGGYQSARQAERDYGLNQQQMGLNERKFGLQKSEFEQRQKLLEKEAADAAKRRAAFDYYYGRFSGFGRNDPSLTPATPSGQQPIVTPYGVPTNSFNPEMPLMPE